MLPSVDRLVVISVPRNPWATLSQSEKQESEKRQHNYYYVIQYTEYVSTIDTYT